MPVTEAELQGFEKPETVTIDARRWQGIRRQLIRLVLAWRYADKEIERVLQGCRHAEGCPATTDRTHPCLPSCPDRETHLSALVIKHNAEAYAMLHRGLPLRPDSEYTPPSRETYDAVVSELEMLREGGDILGQLQGLVDMGAVPSPWVDPSTVIPVPKEKVLSRLVPVGQEDGLDENVDEQADTDRPPPEEEVIPIIIPTEETEST